MISYDVVSFFKIIFNVPFSHLFKSDSVEAALLGLLSHSKTAAVLYLNCRF